MLIPMIEKVIEVNPDRASISPGRLFKTDIMFKISPIQQKYLFFNNIPITPIPKFMQSIPKPRNAKDEASSSVITGNLKGTISWLICSTVRSFPFPCHQIAN